MTLQAGFLRPSGRTRQGFTLIELTVYSALLGVLLSAVYAVFALSMRYFTVARAATELQTQAQQAVLHMSSEIADSTGSSIVVENGTSFSGIIVLSPRDRLGNFQQDAQGNLIWQKWICYRWDSSSRVLWRKALDLSAPTITPPVNPYTLTTFSMMGALAVAKNMTGMQITGTDSIKINATFDAKVYSNASGTADNRVDIIEQI